MIICIGVKGQRGVQVIEESSQHDTGNALAGIQTPSSKKYSA